MMFYQLARYRQQWRKLTNCLNGLFPVQCAACGRWVAKDKTEYAEHRVAGWVRVCRKCYREMYGER